ncbi:MAG: NAD-binding protein [Halobacteriovoraceae bacterium]|nr:NAD-binding protein [Halobacteriovoraceae bacterium]
MDRNQQRYSIILILLLFSLTGVGTLGYMYIEGWNLNDSFYMTIITLTTTGFSEVNNLSSVGRLFTVILLLVGMGVVAYSVTGLMSIFFSMDLSQSRRKKMQKKINQLSGHIIVCGFGRMGKIICKELEFKKREFVVIEKSENLISDLQKSDYLWLEGDATHDEHLISAGVERASFLAAMVDNDADNLYLSLAARGLNPDIYIIARASEEEARPKIIRAGANKVVLPISMSAHKVAQTLVNPDLEEIIRIEGIRGGDTEVELIDLPIKDYSKLKGKNLVNCGLKRDGIIVVGVRKSDGSFIFAPPSDYEFASGDVLLTLTHKETFNKVLSCLE